MRVSDEMQHQAKALADPSRFRLFRHILEAGGPVGVAELTELLGFNHNAIRQHVAILVDARLVAEANERRTVRGRPRKQYWARLDALSAFRSVSGSYERLAELLLEVATSDDNAYDVGYRAGRATAGSVEGRARATDTDTDTDTGSASVAEAVNRLVRQLSIDGFEPVRDADDALALMHCPFADVASKDPGVVCELHRGLLDGQLSNAIEELVSELTPREPHGAGCQVVVGRPHEFS